MEYITGSSTATTNSSVSSNSSGNANRSEYRRSSIMAGAWPEDIDLHNLYGIRRRQIEHMIADSLDLTQWTLTQTKNEVTVYQHKQNNAKMQSSIRVVFKVAMSVKGAIEVLRLLDNFSFRSMMKEMQGKTFIDGEVLHSNVRQGTRNSIVQYESLSLKWLALSSGKTFSKPKEYLYSEYCAVVDSNNYGHSGVCMFESYDGVGARYGIRAKPDSYKLALFEPSAFIAQPSAEPGKSVITLTLTSKKAGGSNSVSSALSTLVSRFAQNYGNLDGASRLCSVTPQLIDREKWVGDSHRPNCSLCLEAFSMIRRRHHCRICGSLVCANCTQCKFVGTDMTKIRVCKECLAKENEVNTVIDVPNKLSLRRPNEPEYNGYLTPQYMKDNQSSSGSMNDEHYIHSAPQLAEPYHKQRREKQRKRKESSAKRRQYVNEDFEELCRCAMQSMNCPMAGIRTDLFEIVQYKDGDGIGLPRSLPTFRRMAKSGKPCVVLDVNSDKRISVDKKMTTKIQFFVGVPLVLENGECIGDICVADMIPRKVIEYQDLEVLKLLAQSASQYMSSKEYLEETSTLEIPHESDLGGSNDNQMHELEYTLGVKEVAF